MYIFIQIKTEFVSFTYTSNEIRLILSHNIRGCLYCLLIIKLFKNVFKFNVKNDDFYDNYIYLYQYLFPLVHII